MRKLLMLMFTTVLALSLTSCSNTKINVTGDVLAFAFTCVTNPFNRACYLAFVDAESNIQQSIKLGPHYAASVTYADPYIFIPMHMNIKGIQDITEWVYYVNIYDGIQGRFQVAWQPVEVIPYKDSYIVISALHGSETCVQLFSHDFVLLQEAVQQESFFAKGSFILDNNLFTSAGWGVRRFSLDEDLTSAYIDFPGQKSGVSIAEWNGKIIATDIATTIWLVDPETLEVEKLGDLPSRQGPGVSLVVGDWLLIGDNYSRNATAYNLMTGETRHLSFEDWITHLSVIDDYVIVSHNRGRTLVDSNWEIIETQSIPDANGITNFVQVTLP